MSQWQQFGIDTTFVKNTIFLVGLSFVVELMTCHSRSVISCPKWIRSTWETAHANKGKMVISFGLFLPAFLERTFLLDTIDCVVEQL